MTPPKPRVPNITTVNRYVEVGVDVDIEFTREELLEILGEPEQSACSRVEDVIRRIRIEAEACSNPAVKATLTWAEELVTSHLS